MLDLTKIPKKISIPSKKKQSRINRQLTVPITVWNKVLTLAPQLAHAPTADKLFAVHIASGNLLKDEDTGLPRIGCDFLASLSKKQARHMNTKKFLLQFKENYDNEFAYIDYSHQHEKQRRLTKSIFHTTLFSPIAHLEKRIHLVTLETITEHQKRENVLHEREMAQINAVFVNKDQELIATYHNTQSLCQTKSQLDLHFEQMHQAICAKGDEHILHLAHKIYSYYGMSILVPSRTSEDGGRTPRLFDQVGGQRLPKYARTILYTGCAMLDFKNCQLAILIRLLNDAKAHAWLQDIMNSGKSLWHELAKYMEIDRCHWDKVKDGLKKAIYSIVFGMPCHNVEQDLKWYLEEEHDTRKRTHRTNDEPVKTLYETHGLCLEKTRNISKHPIIKSLLVGITTLKKTIQHDGGMEGPNGWVPYTKDMKIIHFFAMMMQAYEVHLIAACYEVAMAQKKNNHEDFDILLYLFDGIIVKVREGRDQTKVLNTIIKKVMKRVNQLGIATQIEIEIIKSREEEEEEGEREGREEGRRGEGEVVYSPLCDRSESRSGVVSCGMDVLEKSAFFSDEFEKAVDEEEFLEEEEMQNPIQKYRLLNGMIRFVIKANKKVSKQKEKKTDIPFSFLKQRQLLE